MSNRANRSVFHPVTESGDATSVKQWHTHPVYHLRRTMRSFRPIFVSVIVALVAIAQQMCCCAVGPMVHDSCMKSTPEAGHRCCHHDPDHDSASGLQTSSEHDHPTHHDCDCRHLRTLIPLETKVRLVVDGDGDPAAFGSCSPTGAWWFAALCPEFDSHTARARAGPWPGTALPPIVAARTPLAQRVLLTI